MLILESYSQVEEVLKHAYTDEKIYKEALKEYKEFKRRFGNDKLYRVFFDVVNFKNNIKTLVYRLELLSDSNASKDMVENSGYYEVVKALLEVFVYHPLYTNVQRTGHLMVGDHPDYLDNPFSTLETVQEYYDKLVKNDKLLDFVTIVKDSKPISNKIKHDIEAKTLIKRYGDFNLYHINSIDGLKFIRENVGWCIAASENLFNDNNSSGGIFVLQYMGEDANICAKDVFGEPKKINMSNSYATEEHIKTSPLSVAIIKTKDNTTESSIFKQFKLYTGTKYITDPHYLKMLLKEHLSIDNIKLLKPWYTDEMDYVITSNDYLNNRIIRLKNLIREILGDNKLKQLPDKDLLLSIIVKFTDDLVDIILPYYNGEYTPDVEKHIDNLEDNNIRTKEIQINTNDYRYRSDYDKLFMADFIKHKLLTEVQLTDISDEIVSVMGNKTIKNKSTLLNILYLDSVIEKQLLYILHFIKG